MHRASLPLLLTMVVSLAACPPGGQDSTTTSEPGSSSSLSGSTTSDSTPTTAGSTDPTSIGSSTTGDDTDGATTSVDPGTTQPVDTTGDATTGDATTGDGTTGDGTTGDGTTGDGTTGDGTTGTTSGGSTSTGESGDPTGLPDTTGGEVCEAGPEQVDIEWSLEVPPALVGKSLTASCKLVSSQEMGPEVVVSLSCFTENDTHTLVLHYSLQPDHSFVWNDDRNVQLTYITEPGPWTNEWLKVTAGLTNFWGVHADRLKPPNVEVTDFYGLDVGLKSPCDPQPDTCGQRQGLKVVFEHWVESDPAYVSIGSGEHTVWGFPVQSHVWLEQATRLLEPIGCDNVAPVWLDFVYFEDFSNF